MVVERFGLFWDVKFAGPRILIPWVDNPVMTDDFLQKEVELFKGIDIDFIGGSAPIVASAWYQVGNPADLDLGTREARDRIREQVLKYTYRVQADARASRVAKIFQGAFRTLLEQVDIPTAQKDMEKLATDGTAAARPALAEIGVYPFPEKGIIVEDIALPKELVAFREQQTKGQADAAEAINRSRSFWEPLAKMKEELEKQGITMTSEELRAFYMSQKGLEALAGTKANITFVSPDIKGVGLMIGTEPKGAQK
jgi:hypothetical protein